MSMIPDLPPLPEDVCVGCGEAQGAPHDESCFVVEHEEFVAGKSDAALWHDPDECELCLQGKEVKSECRCGNCCERLLIEATLLDAQREPKIRQFGRLYRDQYLYLLNGSDGPCVFFDRERRLCTIYETRPLCCRLFQCDDEQERLVSLE